jgi:CBS domain-containing protein
MAVIESLMKTEMVTAAQDDTVARAAWSMARNGVGAVLVLEGEKLVGILSERDVLERVVAEDRDPKTTTVGEVATSEIFSVDVGARVRACAELLCSKGVRHLPVLRDGRPVGILSSRDFLAYVVEGLEQVIDKARYEQALAEGEDPYDHIGGSYAK